MKTILHYYYLDTSKPAEREQYRAMVKQLQAIGLVLFDYSAPLEKWDWWDKTIRPLDGQPVELETEYLFDNQWNSAPLATSEQGLRLMDWTEPIYPNRHIHRGYWLEQTEEMKQARANRLKCGYCGKQYDRGTEPGEFCTACQDSPYLKESELHLLRLQSILEDNRPPLTEKESAALLKSYTRAQTIGKKSRAVQAYEKEGEEIEKEYRETIAKAKAEYLGKKWLHSRRVPLDNCIYYSHTGRFCFGWRSPLAPSVAAALGKRLLHFPYPFDLKTE